MSLKLTLLTTPKFEIIGKSQGVNSSDSDSQLILSSPALDTVDDDDLAIARPSQRPSGYVICMCRRRRVGHSLAELKTS